MIIRALAISVACLALGTPAGRAAPLEPERASDTVTLLGAAYKSAKCGVPDKAGGIVFALDRLLDKNGVAIETFTIPFGKVLVVTSFDWLAGGTTLLANHTRTASLFRFVSGLDLNLQSPSAMSTVLSDFNGRAGGSETFPTGLVVQRPAQLCMEIDELQEGEVIIGVVNGYLAPDK